MCELALNDVRALAAARSPQRVLVLGEARWLRPILIGLGISSEEFERITFATVRDLERGRLDGAMFARVHIDHAVAEEVARAALEGLAEDVARVTLPRRLPKRRAFCPEWPSP